MSGEFFLDTNIVIQLIRKQPAVVNNVRMARRILLPVIVVGELFHGVEKSAKRDTNRLELSALLSQASVVNIDREIAETYGSIKRRLELNRKLIPENDLWIAATALQHHIPLVTRDRHFEHVAGLEIVTWDDAAKD